MTDKQYLKLISTLNAIFLILSFILFAVLIGAFS